MNTHSPDVVGLRGRVVGSRGPRGTTRVVVGRTNVPPGPRPSIVMPESDHAPDSFVIELKATGQDDRPADGHLVQEG